MMNTTTLLLKNQAKQTKNLLPALDSLQKSPKAKISFVSVEKKILALKPGEIAVLNYFLYLNHRHTELHPAQMNIGPHLGYSREWVNKCIRDLVKAGLLYKRNRGVKKTCLYYLPKFFSYSYFRAKLHPLLNALKMILPATLLMLDLTIRPHQLSDFTRWGVSLNNIYINSSLVAKNVSLNDDRSSNSQPPLRQSIKKMGKVRGSPHLPIENEYPDAFKDSYPNVYAKSQKKEKTPPQREEEFCHPSVVYVPKPPKALPTLEEMILVAQKRLEDPMLSYTVRSIIEDELDQHLKTLASTSFPPPPSRGMIPDKRNEGNPIS